MGRNRGVRHTVRKAVESAADKVINMIPHGVSGLRRSGGYLYDEFHPKLQGKKAIETFREMADNDAICGMVLFAHESLVKQAPRELKAADESEPQAVFYRDRIAEMMGDMSHTGNEWTSDMMSAEWAGYSFHEIVWKIRRGDNPMSFARSKYNDALWAPRKVEIRAQDSLEEWEFQQDGGVDGVWQCAYPDFNRTFLPIEHSVLYRFRNNKNSPEGKSLLRNAYRPWWFLKRIEELEAIGIERDMAGLLVFQMPTEFFAASADAGKRAAVATWRKVVARARRGQYDGLVIPAETDRKGATGFKASLMQSGGRRPMDTDGVVRRLQSRIAVSVLMDGPLLGQPGDGGSWALASNKTSLAAMTVKSLMTSRDDTDNRYLIPRIMEANNWPQDAAPFFEYGDIESEATAEFATTIGTLTSAGVLTPGEELEKYVRVRVGVPDEVQIDLTDPSPQLQDAIGAHREAQEETPDAIAAMQSEQAAAEAIPIKEEEGSKAEYITAADASDLLGISVSRVNRAVDTGQLPGASVGRTRMIHRASLLDYFAGKKAT